MQMLTCWHSAAAVEVQVGQRIAFVFFPVLGLWHLVTTRTRYLWKGHIHPGWYSAAIEESLGIKLSQDTFVICEQRILGTADKLCSQAYFELTLLSLSSAGAARNPACVPGIAARHASLCCAGWGHSHVRRTCRRACLGTTGNALLLGINTASVP